MRNEKVSIKVAEIRLIYIIIEIIFSLFYSLFCCFFLGTFYSISILNVF